jgi:sugar transferase (PEP-CTERM system associated)
MIRIFGHYISRVFIGLGLAEFLVLAFSMLAGYYVRLSASLDPAAAPPTEVGAAALAYAVVTVTAMTAVGLYQRGLPWGAGFLVRIGLALLLSGVAMAPIYYAIPELDIGRGVMIFALLFSLVGVLAIRSLFLRFAGSDALNHRVLVLGTGRSAGLIEDMEGPQQQFNVVGYVNLGDADERISAERQTILEGRLFDLMLGHDADELVVAVDDRRKRLPVDDILDCKMSGIKVLDLPTFFEKEASLINIDIVNPSWIFFSSGFYTNPFMERGKRLMDIFGALTLLVLFLPFTLMAAIAILVESRGRGPILYSQERVGKGGKPFRLYKFRSMRTDAEADGVERWATQDDNRITGVGRFIRKARLDELPQLYNVLRGQMSLVGPRPERPNFVRELASKIRLYNERHRVKPGLTGWAQLQYAYGSSEDDAKKKLEYDLYYVKNCSIFLDLVILLQTVEVVLWGKGAR